MNEEMGQVDVNPIKNMPMCRNNRIQKNYVSKRLDILLAYEDILFKVEKH